MAGKYTFTMIKVQTVKNNNTGAILKIINENDFRIRALKMIKLSRDQAKQFYAVHKKKPFFDALIDFMCSGPIVAAILEKNNAVEEYRKIIGSTNPEEAAEGSIRRLFGSSTRANAVHGSDSDENARMESEMFFAGFERF